MVESRRQALDEAETENLNDTEQSALQKAFERILEDTWALDTEVIGNKKQEYLPEVEFAAAVAKAQLDKRFAGGQGGANSFVIDQISPHYFGYQSWENTPDTAADDTQTWLDSSQPDELGGASDAPLIIGENAVHVVMGVKERAESPRENLFYWEINNEPQTTLTTDEQFRDTDLQLAWLDSPHILKEDTEYFGEHYAPTSGYSEVGLVGVSFIDGREARVRDPGTLSGTQTAGNVVVEQ